MAAARSTALPAILISLLFIACAAAADVPATDSAGAQHATIEVDDEAEFASRVAAREHALVIFFAPWCGHSRRVLPHFREAARRLASSHAAVEGGDDDATTRPGGAPSSPDLAFATVDATQHKVLSAAHEVAKYPKLVWYAGGVREKYTGGLASADDIEQWVRRRVEGVLLEARSATALRAELATAAAAASKAHPSVAVVGCALRSEPRGEGVEDAPAIGSGCDAPGALVSALREVAEAYERLHRNIPARFVDCAAAEGGDARDAPGAVDGEAGAASGGEGADDASCEHACAQLLAPHDAPTHPGTGRAERRAPDVLLVRYGAPNGSAAFSSLRAWAAGAAGGAGGGDAEAEVASRAAPCTSLLASVGAHDAEDERRSDGGGTSVNARARPAPSECGRRLGQFVRLKSRPLVSPYTPVSQRWLFDPRDNSTRFHLIALLPALQPESAAAADSADEAEADEGAAEPTVAEPAAAAGGGGGDDVVAAQVLSDGRVAATPPAAAASARARRRAQRAAATAQIRSQLLPEAAAALEGEATAVLLETTEGTQGVLTFLALNASSLPAVVLLDTNRTKAFHAYVHRPSGAGNNATTAVKAAAELEPTRARSAAAAAAGANGSTRAEPVSNPTLAEHGALGATPAALEATASPEGGGARVGSPPALSEPARLPSTDELVRYVRAARSGRLRARVRSEPEPEPTGAADGPASPLKKLVGRTFARAAHDAHTDLAVLFHTPWCAHSRALLPLWAELANTHDAAGDTGLVVAELDMSVNEAEGVTVHTFPAVYIFPAQRPSPGGADQGPRADRAGGDPTGAGWAVPPRQYMGGERSVAALQAFIDRERSTVAPAALRLQAATREGGDTADRSRVETMPEPADDNNV